MNYGICICCNKVIKFQDIPLCEDCKDKYLHSVKAYIYENGMKKTKDIHDATSVPVRVIQYFLNNGYLTLSSSTSEDELRKNLSEEERIRKLALLDALTSSFNDKTPVEEDELKGEMHFLGRGRRR